jgi:hypothetical protein
MLSLLFAKEPVLSEVEGMGIPPDEVHRARQDNPIFAAPSFSTTPM